MTYRELLQGIAYEGTAPGGEATLVTQDSRKAAPGAVFVCVVGRTSDGHAFAQRALDAGAGLLVTQRRLGLPNEVTVADSRAAYASLCARFFGNPAAKLTLVGVTGTNGKTSTSTVLKNLLQSQGLRCGLIGTIRSEIGEVEIPAKFTTPEAWDLHALFARMVAAGCTHVVMEASSQALHQGRLHGLQFKLGIFTNLSTDHLDYHGDMESYFEAKRLLFAQSEAMLVNTDDAYGRQLLAGSESGQKYSFSAAGQEADFSARDVRLQPDGVRFALLYGDALLPVKFPMPGEYSVANALAAFGAAVLLGCAPAQTVQAMKTLPGVPGRCEVLYSGDFTVISDFAHTDDALENLLGTLRPFVAGRMLVLFGPAGSRDGSKRARMGEIAAEYADKVYLTADNPREEPLEKIFAETLPGIQKSGKPFEAVEDRTAAVRAALAELREGDMLVLAGKGHEDYQVLNGVTVYYSEKEILADWFKEKQ